MTSRRTGIAWGVSLLVAFGPFVAVRAQTRTDSERAALEAFRRGNAAASEHQYATAARAFEESCRLGCAPVARYNLAFAYRELGQLRAAITSFERYLADETRFPAGREVTVREALRELRTRLAGLRLTVTPAVFVLFVDGQVTALDVDFAAIDPGEHELQVTAPGHRVWVNRVQFAPGQTITRAITLAPDVMPVPAVTPLPATAPPVEEPPPASRSRESIAAPSRPVSPPVASPSIASRWWFWVGVAALVAGATLATFVVLDATATVEPPAAGTGFDIQTLRVSWR